MKVLIVEDEDAIAEPLVEGLGREGFAVERAATGPKRPGRAEADIVLLDLRLPDIDGLDGLPPPARALARCRSSS